MEAALRKSVHGGIVKEEMKAESSGDEDGCKEEILHKVGNGRIYDLQDDTLKTLSPTQKEPTMYRIETSSADANLRASSSARKEQDDPLESAKAEIGDAIQENQRLRVSLDRITKDYRNLQMQFQDIVQQEAKKSTSTVNAKHESEEPELVSLSLGRTSSDTKTDEIRKICTKEKVDEDDKQGLALGLDCNFEMPNKEPVESSTNLTPENSIEVVKQEAGERWPPHKMLKTARSGEDDVSQQNLAKRARVSVRVRCDTPTMNDGCQWRKYGQKISKGNPCPRAYYRCTVAPNCPVRKQVQRFAEDMTILISTYEGTHNHSLPVAATAMASTTSAAASMLLSGSSSSGSGPSQSANSTNINAMNFSLSDNSKSKPFYPPNSSISSSLSNPTITLDLTSSSSSSLSPLNRVGSFPPRYSSTNLNFSSLESNALPISWSNGVLNCGTTSYNNNQINSLSFGRQPQDNVYKSYLQKNIMNNTQPPLPPDTIAAATEAITSDPRFQSALAAALSSIIGSASGNATTQGNQVLADNKSGQSFKLAKPFPVLSSFLSTSNADKCASSFLNKPPSTANSQPGSFFPLHPSLSFSTCKSKSSSPGDNRDDIL